MTPTAISTSGTVALILAALFCATVAHAAEMPKDLVGSWCRENPDEPEAEAYIRCKVGEEDFVIGRKHSAIEHSVCEVLSESEQGKRAWVTKERCKSESTPKAEVVTIRYVRRGAVLYVKEGR